MVYKGTETPCDRQAETCDRIHNTDRVGAGEKKVLIMDISDRHAAEKCVVVVVDGIFDS